MGRVVPIVSISVLTLSAVVAAVYLAVAWPTVPTEQKIAAFWLIALTVHSWEEDYFPGGFAQLIGDRWGVTVNKSAGAVAPHSMILVIGGLAFFFHSTPWLIVAPLVIGVFEMISHGVVAKVGLKVEGWYNPGLVTMLLAIMPVTIFGLWYVISAATTGALDWILGILFAIGTLVLMELAVFTASGVRPKDLLARMRPKDNPGT